ncbi:MAG: hypothetical protein DME97_00105 [Verrucomicrobia bacterium]|nr:MAG: hypothetical protein DME97_00105 [Verrucomicrobiota bacterium]
MFTGGGTVVARYDYDPYGRSTTVLGTTPTDFNFTGLYRHSKSNLDLATYRAYDPDLGRWLSRDPIGERGGINLYGYVGNTPANLTDRLGLLFDGGTITIPGVTIATGGGGLGAAAIAPITAAAVLGAGAGYLLDQIPAVRNASTDLMYNLFYRNQEGPDPWAWTGYHNSLSRRFWLAEDDCLRQLEKYNTACKGKLNQQERDTFMRNCMKEKLRLPISQRYHGGKEQHSQLALGRKCQNRSSSMEREYG